MVCECGKEFKEIGVHRDGSLYYCKCGTLKIYISGNEYYEYKPSIRYCECRTWQVFGNSPHMYESGSGDWISVNDDSVYCDKCGGLIKKDNE